MSLDDLGAITNEQMNELILNTKDVVRRDAEYEKNRLPIPQPKPNIWTSYKGGKATQMVLPPGKSPYDYAAPAAFGAAKSCGADGDLWSWLLFVACMLLIALVVWTVRRMASPRPRMTMGCPADGSTPVAPSLCRT